MSITSPSYPLSIPLNISLGPLIIASVESIPMKWPSPSLISSLERVHIIASNHASKHQSHLLLKEPSEPSSHYLADTSVAGWLTTWKEFNDRLCSTRRTRSPRPFGSTKVGSLRVDSP